MWGCAVVAGLFWASLGALHVHAQVPLEERFSEALTAFEAEDYSRAHGAFLALYRIEPSHDYTTAALLMAGKSLYRMGHYQESIDALYLFLSRYAESDYLREAEQVIAYARLRLRHEEEQEGVLRLGVAMPLNVKDPSTTQALFNGIHVAVNGHNQSGAQPPVRIIFRDTHRSRDGAYEAVRSLLDQDVDAIIGPLYSDEVKRTASLVDAAGVVMVAPLATAPDIVSSGFYVFQVSPSFEERGRFMARQAVQRLGHRVLGVVSESEQGRSVEMARGFEVEAAALGAEIAFHHKIDAPQDWTRISEDLGEEALASISALYLPVHRPSVAEERGLVEAMLMRFGTMSGLPDILGTKSWADIQLRTAGNTLNIFYADAFHVRPLRSEVRRFHSDYQAIGLGAPDHLAYVGFDVASFLIGRMLQEEPLVRQLMQAGVFEGVGTRIHFGPGRSNKTMFLLKIDDRGTRWLY